MGRGSKEEGIKSLEIAAMKKEDKKNTTGSTGRRFLRLETMNFWW